MEAGWLLCMLTVVRSNLGIFLEEKIEKGKEDIILRSLGKADLFRVTLKLLEGVA
jgi:hypothetical protein